VTIPQRPGPRRVDCGPKLGKLHGGRLLKDGAWSWPVGRFGVRTDAAFAERVDDYPTDHWWHRPTILEASRVDGLWPHQSMALDDLSTIVSAEHLPRVPARRVGWEMPLGSGKTRLSIEAAKLWRAANPDRGQLVVVLPLAVWSGWVRNLARWWPEATIGAAKGWHTPVTRGWSPEQRAEMRSQVADLTPATAQSVDVVLSHWLCGDGAWAVVEAARPAVVVLDEVHRAKSTSARAHLRVNRTFAHGAIDSPGLLIGMSGTPMGQRPPELHGVQRLLDPTVFGWAASPHHARYFRRDEGASRAAGHDIPGAEFLSDEHAKRWRERRALSWLVVSPDSIERDWSVTAWETLDVDIGPDSRDAATMKRDGVWTSPDGRVELIGDNALARRTHVHRLESGVADGQHDADHRTAKIKALGELLGERTEWPVIVWCTWRRTMDLVTVEAERLGLTVGEISGASKSGLSAAGRAAEGVDVVVCQVAAASEGIELVEAELAVWVDLPTSLTLWRQAVGRNDRAAESTHWREPVAVVLLGGEVDRTIWAALRDGYALQAEITAAMEAELLAAIDRASGLS
jgi:hypothetical protein